MDESPSIMLNERSQPQKVTYCVNTFIVYDILKSVKTINKEHLVVASGQEYKGAAQISEREGTILYPDCRGTYMSL